MMLSGDYKISGTNEELCSLLACIPVELTMAITQLKNREVASVDEQNGVITLTSRRRQRDYKIKEERRKAGRLSGIARTKHEQTQQQTHQHSVGTKTPTPSAYAEAEAEAHTEAEKKPAAAPPASAVKKPEKEKDAELNRNRARFFAKWNEAHLSFFKVKDEPCSSKHDAGELTKRLKVGYTVDGLIEIAQIAWSKQDDRGHWHCFQKSKFISDFCIYAPKIKKEIENEKNTPNNPGRVDRSIGTTNEGLASQYRGIKSAGMGGWVKVSNT